jgi:5-methyltetrahydrofolate--homocysteine methyltransferase
VHASFLEVGCDVLETDTFRSNRLTLREYGLHDRVLEINRAAAALARRVADRFATADRPRFVAGSIGPSGFLPSTSDPCSAPSRSTSWSTSSRAGARPGRGRRRTCC